MAWNEPGDNGQRNPWGKKSPGGGKAPNLDQLLKNVRNRLGRLGGGSGGIVTIVLALLIAWMLLSSYTIINTSQNGVVLRFGHYSRTLGPGYIAEALGLARRADPSAQLFVNEFGTLEPGPRQERMFRLVEDLRAAGAPLDAVGFDQERRSARS